MTVFAETNVDVDLRMLRSFRVLRPLKLVSKIPSESVRVPSSKEQRRLTQASRFYNLKKISRSRELAPSRRRFTSLIPAIFCIQSSLLPPPPRYASRQFMYVFIVIQA